MEIWAHRKKLELKIVSTWEDFIKIIKTHCEIFKIHIYKIPVKTVLRITYKMGYKNPLL